MFCPRFDFYYFVISMGMTRATEEKLKNQYLGNALVSSCLAKLAKNYFISYVSSVRLRVRVSYSIESISRLINNRAQGGGFKLWFPTVTDKSTLTKTRCNARVNTQCNVENGRSPLRKWHFRVGNDLGPVAPCPWTKWPTAGSSGASDSARDINLFCVRTVRVR